MEFEITPDVAFIVGVYFSDGSMSVNSSQKYVRWQLTSIDQDFVERVRDAFYRTFDDVKTEIHCYPPHKSSHGKSPVYRWSYTNGGFCEWLFERTVGKTTIPWEILESHELRQKFLQGYLDGDGYITIRVNFMAGFRGTNKYVVESVGEILRQEKVKLGKRCEYKTPKGKALYGYNINAESLAKSGFSFGVKRKQKRLDIVKLLRRSSTTLRRTLTGILQEFLQEKIKSELTGDSERIAEMTIPPDEGY